MEAAWWLNDRMAEWLGEKGAADLLSQSLDNNVTSEMGLALLDVADAIRPHPEVVALLERVDGDDGFLDALPAVPGGREARDAIVGWLERYGMRCVGEIDVTRPRWAERPSTLIPLILGNVRSFAPGAGKQRFEAGLREVRDQEADLLERLRALPDGQAKAEETRAMIARVRTFAGYREFPKYHLVSRYFVYKRALLAEAERLVRAGALDQVEDAFCLSLDELKEVSRTRRVDRALIRERQDAFRWYRTLT
jgi:pyruvate,water dikinase